MFQSSVPTLSLHSMQFGGSFQTIFSDITAPPLDTADFPTCRPISEKTDKSEKTDGGDKPLLVTSFFSQTDSGYAWVVLSACCFIRLLVSFGESMMGVLLVELMHSFDASIPRLVAASTTQLGLSMTLSIFASMCVSLIGSRAVLMIGSLITTIGFFSTAFVTNIDLFFLTYGAISAFGMSFMIMGPIIPLYSYFDKRKSLALGLYTASYNIGNFAMAPLMTLLFEEYGWRGCFMILAGFYLNGIVAGALMRPFRYDAVTIKTPPAAICKMWKVFKNKHFLHYSVFIFLGYTGFSFAAVYLPGMALRFGSSNTEASLLVSLFAINCCLSRILLGFLGDLQWMRENRLIMMICAYVIAGIAKICFIKATTYAHLAAFAVVDGITNGAGSLLYTISCDLVKVEHQSISVSVILVCAGAGIIIGNSVTGYMYSYFGSLNQPAITFGCIQIFAALLASCLYAILKCHKPNTKEDENQSTL